MQESTRDTTQSVIQQLQSTNECVTELSHEALEDIRCNYEKNKNNALHQRNKRSRLSDIDLMLLCNPRSKSPWDTSPANAIVTLPDNHIQRPADRIQRILESLCGGEGREGIMLKPYLACILEKQLFIQVRSRVLQQLQVIITHYYTIIANGFNYLVHNVPHQTFVNNLIWCLENPHTFGVRVFQRPEMHIMDFKMPARVNVGLSTECLKIQTLLL